MSLNDELRFYTATEAADILDIAPSLVRYTYPEMHLLHTPEKSRPPVYYVDDLAASEEWQEREHISTATALFAGGVAAQYAIARSESQLETTVQSAIEASGDGRLSSTTVADLLGVSHTSLNRWRTSGAVPMPSRQGKLQTVTVEEFRQHYAWQRPASSPIANVPLTPARLSTYYSDPEPKSIEQLELPKLVRAITAAGILAIDRTVVTDISLRLHRLRTPAPFYQYPESYLRLLARSITWDNPYYSKDQSAQFYAQREEAASVINGTEAIYNDAITRAYQVYAKSGVIPDHIAGRLLGISKDTMSNWRSSGHIHPTARMTRQHLEELFVWERPTTD